MAFNKITELTVSCYGLSRKTCILFIVVFIISVDLEQDK